VPGGAERILRRRITSVTNTKKITRAMELIAATRVARAQARARTARPYAELLTGVIEDLAAGGAEASHPLLRQAEAVQNVAFIVCAGDRGLAGAYNSGVIRSAEREIQALRAEGGGYKLIGIGKKVGDYFRFRGFELDAEFNGFSDNPTYENAREVARHIRELFDFLSLGSQRPVVRRFLPLESSATISAEGGGDASRLAGASFEPSPEGVLEDLLPRYVEARLFAALLDAAASEHANRQRAMKAATENAEDLIVKLSRIMNRARQESITTEIMEIVSGAESLAADQESGSEPLINDGQPADNGSNV
jgi:F-type H+-transporting ATPase subunit gamma